MIRQRPLITVVISLRNDAVGLQTTLKSLIDQDGVDSLEVLIVDGNSLDAPVKVVDQFSGQVQIRFYAGFDRGIYSAWNKAVALAKGDWLTFVGAGDTFTPNAINALAQRAGSEAEADVISSKSRNLYARGTELIAGSPFVYNEFVRKFTLNHSGLLYRRTIFERYGNFDERYESSGDYEFLLRIGRLVRFAYLDMVVSNFPVGGISSSSTLALRENYRIRKSHQLVGRVENVSLYLRAYVAFQLARFR